MRRRVTTVKGAGHHEMKESPCVWIFGLKQVRHSCCFSLKPFNIEILMHKLSILQLYNPHCCVVAVVELEAIKARVREMEEEAEKLKELQNEVEKQMNLSPPPVGPVIMSIEEKMEADGRSIYVGNVDYGATAEELEAHFHGCGSVNRVTILCDKYTGHPKGFAYIEFADKESVRTAMALDESLFRGRQIKVGAKRTNRPGISTTDRGFPRARFRSRGGSFSSRARYYSGYTPPRGRGRAFRGRGRTTSWYSPY
uniref:Poly(A) binding protein, nuclear 1 n=1 Tax=Scophthalmus maximus TaxID=52904 RepID=A0A8D3BMF9_SCOMX